MLTENITSDTVPRLAIYSSSQKTNGKWSEPRLWTFSGKYKDYEPTISPDGQLLFFNSNRPLSGSRIESKNNIWFSSLENGTWQEPKSLQHINTNEFEESYPSMASNSKLIYSKEVVVSGKSQYHLFETYFDGVHTKNGKRIVFPNFQFEASDPHISADGDYLVFTGFHSSNWNNTCNLYISFFEDGKWSEPKAIVELNSKGPDFAAFVSFDDRYIFYRKSYQYIKLPFQNIMKKYR